MRSVKHLNELIGQTKSSQSLTDDLVSTAVTQLPGLMRIPFLRVGSTCHELPCGDLTPGPHNRHNPAMFMFLFSGTRWWFLFFGSEKKNKMIILKEVEPVKMCHFMTDAHFTEKLEQVLETLYRQPGVDFVTSSINVTILSSKKKEK